jgi:hypothetical protein
MSWVVARIPPVGPSAWPTQDILAKLGARNRTQAVIAAYESGFVSPEARPEVAPTVEPGVERRVKRGVGPTVGSGVDSGSGPPG